MGFKNWRKDCRSPRYVPQSSMRCHGLDVFAIHVVAIFSIGIHDGAITSIQFHPTDTSKVLTNGMDSRIKVTDIRTCSPVHTLAHAEFQTSFGWSPCSFSPDGKHEVADPLLPLGRHDTHIPVPQGSSLGLRLIQMV